MKVSAIMATGMICLVLGIGIGVLAMTYIEYEGAGRVGQPSVPAPPRPGGAPGMMGAPGGGPPGMGGFRGPNPKFQLASLVTKLDLLAGASLTVNLTDDQKTAVAGHLQGLDAADELTEDEAKNRLDALLEVLKEHQATLESAGYRWPGQGGFRPPADTPNPFKDEQNAASLKSLQERLSAAAAKQP